MAEEPDRRRARLQHRLTAVPGDVVHVDDAHVGRQVPGHRRQDAPLVAENQRLVRGVHRRSQEPGGQLRLGRIRHVEDVHPTLRVQDVGRVHQRGVVVRAVVTGGIRVPLDLEAAHGADRIRLPVRAHQLGVAREALRSPAALVILGADPALEAGLGPGAEAAGSLRGWQQRRFRRERRCDGFDIGARRSVMCPSVAGSAERHGDGRQGAQSECARGHC